MNQVPEGIAESPCADRLRDSRSRRLVTQSVTQGDLGLCITSAKLLASPARFERTAPRLGIWCSIRLSYGDSPISLPENRQVRSPCSGPPYSQTARACPNRSRQRPSV